MFPGQEAPVTINSPTVSNRELAPRGLPCRLDRHQPPSPSPGAQRRSHWVAHPQLLDEIPETPAMFAWVTVMARFVAVAAAAFTHAPPTPLSG